MACIRKRRGKYVVDYRDGAGARRWVTCATRREATQILEEKLRESRQTLHPEVDPRITVAEYAHHWLTQREVNLKRRTHQGYRDKLRLHILPTLGQVRLRLLHRGRIKALLTGKLAAGLSRDSVRLIHATLRVMLNSAVDDGILVANPADRLGRTLRFLKSRSHRQQTIKALSRRQLDLFLRTAAKVEPRFAVLFLMQARAGLRLGEVLAVQWSDLDLEERELHLERSITPAREIQTPKSGYGRTVDLSQQLVDALRRLKVARAAETLRRGWGEIPSWVFCSTTGTLYDHPKIDKAFKRILQAAKLPAHFTPHGLRHTYASLLLQQGESPVYVQRQLGHASIQLTVDTYGKWLPMGNKAAVDGLDRPAPEASGSKMVATGTPGGCSDEIPE